MAEFIVPSVLSQLASLVTQEAAFLHGVRDQVDWVKRELQRMEGFLQVALSKRREGDKRVGNWIREIRDVAYEVEDIIDTVKFMAERQRQWRGFMGSLSRYSHKPFELITLHKIGSEIKKVKRKIRHISESRATYGIPNLGESGVEKSSDRDDSLQAMRQFPHFFDDTDVIGFKNDKKQLVKQLLDSDNRRLCVSSIVGMGGLGKTTLARKVYNDPAIREHFGTFAWVSVSQNYRVIDLLKEITKKVTPGITPQLLERMGEEEVIARLHEFLRDKRYLVVMDDVWSMDVWKQVQQVLPNGNNGSRILLTTRKIEVARHAEPWIPPHKLQLLNDTQSLELFLRKAFPPNKDVPSELGELAQKLAKRCGGLPLALVVLGGLLSRKDDTYDAWLKVAQSMNWESSGDGQECLSILGLSYNDLPYQLKPCFLYITAFPEDSTISVSKLVRLWIAEGFIRQEERQKMEDTARDWLDELVQRSMIQVVERSMGRGRVKSIRIHDMLRDFGLSEAKKDGFFHVCSSDNMAVSDGISSHRAAFHNRINDEVAISSTHLRTLLGFKLVLKDSTATGRFLNGLNLLRVLDLEDAEDLKELPKEIGNMIHLRYLGLRNTGLKRLPSSIGHLLNLQTLDVRQTEIKWLPKSFWKIRTLRHLYIHSTMFLSAPISGDHKNLQILHIKYWDVDYLDHMYIINHQGIRFIKNWVTTPGSTKKVILKTYERMFEKSFGKALEKMDNLVSLTLVGFYRNYRTLGDVLFAQPPILYHLHSLRLEGQLVLKLQQLPDSSQFPPNLTKLIILRESKLDLDPMPVLEKLPNLRFLQLLQASVGKSMSCSTGGFPRLQHLILFYLENLEQWRVEVGAMPSLTHLTIDGCLNLEEWRLEVGAMPNLTHLTINYCQKLKMLPEGLQHVTTLRELKLRWMPHKFNERVRYRDGYKVRRIPSIIFENPHISSTWLTDVS